jgi:hypothetical protein
MVELAAARPGDGRRGGCGRLPAARHGGAGRWRSTAGRRGARAGESRWCGRWRTTAVTYCRRAVSAAGSLNCQAAPIWSAIATTKLRVSGARDVVATLPCGTLHLSVDIDASVLVPVL